MSEIALTTQFEHNRLLMDDLLRPSVNFDLVRRVFQIAGRAAAIYFVEAFINSQITERILERLTHLTPEDLDAADTVDRFMAAFVPYTEVKGQQNVQNAALQVLSGQLALLVDGYDQVILLDLRSYPMRSISEPEDDRVLLGAHDGFVEAIKLNTALLRRRIRDMRLRVEAMTVGTKSQTDVAICYMDGIAEATLVEQVRKAIGNVNIPSLSMGEESLEECLLRGQRLNPFPRIRCTERPDHAAAAVLEGKILVIIDNSPVAMILPTAIFDFVQDTNEYYQPPLIGTFLRFVRFIIFMATLFLVPVWFLLLNNPEYLPPSLSFLQIAHPNNVPLIIQLLVVELLIDGVKLASLNTPSSLSSAFGIVGALVLGEFAVNTNMVVEEVLLYMAFVSVATFVQPSFRLGHTFKLYRLLFLLLAAAFDVWGFLGGVALMLATLVSTRTIGGRRYLYPLIPFNAQACWRLLFRRSIHKENS